MSVVSGYVSVKTDLESAVKQMAEKRNLGSYQKEKNVCYEWKCMAFFGIWIQISLERHQELLC